MTWRKLLLLSMVLGINGCLCESILPQDTGAPNVVGPFRGAAMQDDAMLIKLLGMPVSAIKQKVGNWQGWISNCWVDEDPVIIPAWHNDTEIDGWCNVTILELHKSDTARYRMSVSSSVNGPDPGAGFGYGSEVVSRVFNLRLVEKLSRPHAPEGVTPLLPGECVIRSIGGENNRVHKYLVSLPANKRGRINTVEKNFLKGFELEEKITKDGIPVPIFDGHGNPSPPSRYGEFFDTGSGGNFLIEISPRKDLARSWGEYGFKIRWGKSTGSTCGNFY